MKGHDARTAQGLAKNGQRPVNKKLVVRGGSTRGRPEVTHAEMDTAGFQTPSEVEKEMSADMSSWDKIRLWR